MKKYLLAVDGSEDSSRAVQFLLDFVPKDNKVHIAAVHVVSIKKEIYKFSPFTDIENIKQSILAQGADFLREQTAALEKEGLEISRVVLEGDPGREIAGYAQKNDFDVIVMGTRGLSNLEGLVLGSVSHKVLHLSDCPVILVK